MMVCAEFFKQLQAALEGVRPAWSGVIDIEAPGGEWWHVATVGDLPAPVCNPRQWTGGADIVIRAPTDAAWAALTGDPSGLPAAAADGTVTTHSGDDGAAYAWELWGGYVLAWGGYTPVDVAAVSMGVEARGLSMESSESVIVVAALAETETCPQCGAGGVRVAQIGTALACGACLTLALQAVQ